MSMSTGVFTKPLAGTAVQRPYAATGATGKLAGAFDGTGALAAGEWVALEAASCKHGVLVQAIIATAGSYIYLKMSNDKTLPTAATDYSIRLADGDTITLPVDNLDKLFAWTNDTSTSTMLVLTRFN